MTFHIQWKKILSIGSLFLTLGLSVIGKMQSERDLQGKLAVWDYYPKAEVILHSVNYPAAVATALLDGDHTFYIGIEHSIKSFILYLLFVLVLWFVVGYCLDMRIKAIRCRGWAAFVIVLAILYSCLLIIIALSMWGAHPRFLCISGLLWGLTSIAFSARSLLAMRRPDH